MRKSFLVIALTIFPVAAHGQASVINAITQTATSSTTVTVNIPNAQAGDYFILACSFAGASSSTTATSIVDNLGNNLGVFSDLTFPTGNCHSNGGLPAGGPGYQITLTYSHPVTSWLGLATVRGFSGLRGVGNLAYNNGGFCPNSGCLFLGTVLTPTQFAVSIGITPISGAVSVNDSFFTQITNSGVVSGGSVGISSALVTSAECPSPSSCRSSWLNSYTFNDVGFNFAGGIVVIFNEPAGPSGKTHRQSKVI